MSVSKAEGRGYGTYSLLVTPNNGYKTRTFHGPLGAFVSFKTICGGKIKIEGDEMSGLSSFKKIKLSARIIKDGRSLGHADLVALIPAYRVSQQRKNDNLREALARIERS